MVCIMENSKFNRSKPFCPVIHFLFKNKIAFIFMCIGRHFIFCARYSSLLFSQYLQNHGHACLARAKCTCFPLITLFTFLLANDDFLKICKLSTKFCKRCMAVILEILTVNYTLKYRAQEAKCLQYT